MNIRMGTRIVRNSKSISFQTMHRKVFTHASLWVFVQNESPYRNVILRFIYQIAIVNIIYGAYR